MKLFIILFLHQTTTERLQARGRERCLSSCSYIKPQRRSRPSPRRPVVYHLVPTSNHNAWRVSFAERLLFIILFLHQTTTYVIFCFTNPSCLSSCSYIKPQHSPFSLFDGKGCLSSCSYIKPQRIRDTTPASFCCLSSCSYIKPQLVVVPPIFRLSCLSSCSYIKPQLSSRSM